MLVGRSERPYRRFADSAASTVWASRTAMVGGSDATGLDPLTFDEFGPTDCRDDDIGVTHGGGKVSGLEWQ